MTRRLVANLHCEDTWARAADVGPAKGFALPRRALDRASVYGVLMAAFAEPGDRLWTPRTVDRGRLCTVAGLGWPELESGPLEALDAVDDTLWWADVGAAAAEANDRALSVRCAERLGVGLPGAAVVHSIHELTALLEGGALDLAWEERWVCKAPFGASGRGKVQGRGRDPTPATLRGIAHLVGRFGRAYLEPWVRRVEDIGLHGEVGAGPPQFHRLVCAQSGAFRAVTIGGGRPLLADDERAELLRVFEGVRSALRERGYSGPVSIDAFRYLTPDGESRLHPLCEVNARHTFSAVAAALRERIAPDAGEVTLALRDATDEEAHAPGFVRLVESAEPDGAGAFLLIGEHSC